MGLPSSSIPHARQLEIYVKLECAFPYLRLCALHYKSHAVATSDYAHWYKNRYPDTV